MDDLQATPLPIYCHRSCLTGAFFSGSLSTTIHNHDRQLFCSIQFLSRVFPISVSGFRSQVSKPVPHVHPDPTRPLADRLRRFFASSPSWPSSRAALETFASWDQLRHHPPADGVIGIAALGMTLVIIGRRHRSVRRLGHRTRHGGHRPAGAARMAAAACGAGRPHRRRGLRGFIQAPDHPAAVAAVCCDAGMMARSAARPRGLFRRAPDTPFIRRDLAEQADAARRPGLRCRAGCG